jgi:hypothetical protein
MLPLKILDFEGVLRRESFSGVINYPLRRKHD